MFLETIRLPGNSQLVWADAVCIDQQNLGERDQQVKLMGSIYSQAQMVLIWLGPNDHEDTERARALIDHMTTYRMRDQETPPTLQEARDYFTMIERPLWNAFAGILRRPWFERVWVIQEAANASKGLFIVGDQTFLLDEFYLAADTLLHYHLGGLLQFEGPIQGPESLVCMNHIKRHILTESEHELLGALILTRPFNATNPKDKLFGILGLIHDGSVPGLQVDNSMSVTQIYQNISLYFLFSVGSLRILSSVCTVPQNHPIQTPSWVPNWSFKGEGGSYTRNKHYYRATRNTKPEIWASSADNNLVLKGNFVDKVNRFSLFQNLTPPTLTAEDGNIDFAGPLILQKAQRINQYYVLALGNTDGLSEISSGAYDNFLRTLICNRTMEGIEPTPAFIARVQSFVQNTQSLLLLDDWTEWYRYL
ncbi:uncharacterized protein KY384_002793 [Bacidia gigantensis]|uniref:uncharacterized protein n=1 Tax=Bacidia gigantensis TaxID=2732470 RepID=UPI001D048231|nr:uncharacterized protein KY384_002793 [Bacidia gigantensis]KAG8532915.1 hypothetical protein KY384_002793 [Bacidia gigantensis]